MWSRKLDDITTTREQLDPYQSSLIGSSSSKYGQKSELHENENFSCMF